jgi:hypothetical protein
MTHKRGHNTRGRKTGARHTRRRGGGLDNVTDVEKKTSLEVIGQLVPIVQKHVDETASCGSQISGSEDAFVHLGLSQADFYKDRVDPRPIVMKILNPLNPAKLETLYAVYTKVRPQNVVAKGVRGFFRMATEAVTNEARDKGSLKDFLWNILQFRKGNNVSAPRLTCYGGKRVLERLGWLKASLEGKNPPPPPPEDMSPSGSPKAFSVGGGRRTRRRGGDPVAQSSDCEEIWTGDDDESAKARDACEQRKAAAFASANKPSSEELAAIAKQRKALAKAGSRRTKRYTRRR